MDKPSWIVQYSSPEIPGEAQFSIPQTLDPCLRMLFKPRSAISLLALPPERTIVVFTYGIPLCCGGSGGGGCFSVTLLQPQYSLCIYFTLLRWCAIHSEPDNGCCNAYRRPGLRCSYYGGNVGCYFLVQDQHALIALVLGSWYSPILRTLGWGSLHLTYTSKHVSCSGSYNCYSDHDS